MINYFPDYGCAPAMIKFYFIIIALPLPYCCSFFSVLGGSLSFLVSSRFFFKVGGMVSCSTVSCDFAVFVKKGEFTSFYYTTLLANQQLFYPNS